MLFKTQKKRRRNLAGSKTCSQPDSTVVDCNQLPHQLSNRLNPNDENLYLRIVGNIFISTKGGVWRYLCLERSMIHFCTFHSLRFPIQTCGTVPLLSMRGPPRDPSLDWIHMCSHVTPVWSCMQYYAHGNIHNSALFPVQIMRYLGLDGLSEKLNFVIKDWHDSKCFVLSSTWIRFDIGF